MPFDPSQVPEDSTGEGHLDDTPIYDVLLGILAHTCTGRLSVGSPSGQNHMYFMQGRPVGVQLADFFHPLGQLLLELGRIDAPTFIKAQRLISEGNRLPGQVFMQLKVLDETGLREVLAVQATRKAEEFCRLGSRPFAFGRGLTYLSGFQSTPLDVYGVLYLAVRQQMGPASRMNWLAELENKEIRTDPEKKALPAALSVFGFGPPEERFLGRLKSGWQSVAHLSETGTLPNDDMAVLLRFLHILGRLQLRDRPPAPPPPPQRPAPRPVSAPPPVPAPVAAPAPAPAPVAAPPPAPAAVPEADLAAKPRRRRDDREPQAPPGGLSIPVSPEGPHSVTPPKTVKPKRPSPPPLPPPPGADKGEDDGGGLSSVIVAPDLLGGGGGDRRKKKRRRRSEPLPSVKQLAESETKREKTAITPLPTIMIDDD